MNRVRFLIRLLAVSFVLNWIWEMAQMPGYKEMAGKPWKETASRCTRATLGDVTITIWLFGVTALAAHRESVRTKERWRFYLAIAFLGAMQAYWIEKSNLSSGRWSYTEGMPIFPWLNVGVSPLLQLGLLPPAAVCLASCWMPSNRRQGT